MATGFEDLRVLQAAERVADGIWNCVIRWDEFAQDIVGKQLSRAADSVGANIAESYGRYHFGEKQQFLYYARGSLFETKYWLNRAATRNLIAPYMAEDFAAELSNLAQQLNAFLRSLRKQRSRESKPTNGVREPGVTYTTAVDSDHPLFSDADLSFIQSPPTE